MSALLRAQWIVGENLTLQNLVDEIFILEHYKAFAHSLPHHANISVSLTKSQEEISQARTNLIESRDALGSKRADLAQLWSRGQALEEMMRLLDQMCAPMTNNVHIHPDHSRASEKLKAVPDLLESLISEKRLLQAAILLVKSLKIINRPDMLEIGATSDLRNYLTSQEMVCIWFLISSWWLTPPTGLTRHLTGRAAKPSISQNFLV